MDHNTYTVAGSEVSIVPISFVDSHESACSLVHYSHFTTSFARQHCYVLQQSINKCLSINERIYFQNSVNNFNNISLRRTSAVLWSIIHAIPEGLYFH